MGAYLLWETKENHLIFNGYNGTLWPSQCKGLVNHTSRKKNNYEGEVVQKLSRISQVNK